MSNRSLYIENDNDLLYKKYYMIVYFRIYSDKI